MERPLTAFDLGRYLSAGHLSEYFYIPPDTYAPAVAEVESPSKDDCSTSIDGRLHPCQISSRIVQSVYDCGVLCEAELTCKEDVRGT
jgi:hypothetical protein